MPSIHRRHSRQQLLCIYLLLTHACIVYICVWHHSRQRRRMHARWRAQPPALRTVLRQSQKDTPAHNPVCERVQAVILVANYSDVNAQLRAWTSNTQSLAFLRQTLLYWETTRNRKQHNVAFILVPSVGVWPSACTDLHAPVASTCVIRSFSPETHSKLDILHWLQQQSPVNASCVVWDTVVLLQRSELDPYGAKVHFDASMLARLHAAPASRATCLLDRQVKHQEQSCSVSVWKVR